MIKLYRSALHPKHWVAYVPDAGWVMFPARDNGWDHRHAARGLDPLYLRQVPLHMGYSAGVPQPEYLEVA